MTPVFDVIRELDAKQRRLRNHIWPRYVFIHINKTAGSSIERALHLRFEHKTAIEKLAELGSKRWHRAFKFTFVRNPWDKVASHYRYRVRTNQTGMGDGHIAFREWALRAYGQNDPKYYDQPKMFMPQANWICDLDGRPMVDFIGRFESIERDFATISRTIGCTAELPHLKATSSEDYRDWYDDEIAELIANVYAVDLQLFGYTY